VRPFTVAVSCPCAGVSVCTPTGEVDAFTSSLLREQLVTATAEARHLVIDLSGVTFFSAAGAEVLMAARAGQQGRGALVLACPPRPVQIVLDILSLTHLFCRSDDVDAAVATCA